MLDNQRDYDEQRKQNILGLDKMILFGSPNDGIISPWQSAWFGVWQEGGDSEVVEMEDRDIY